MFEPVIIGEILGFPLYAYGLWVAVATGICLMLAARRARRKGLAPRTIWIFGIAAIPLGIWGGHWFYCAVRAMDLFPEYGVGILMSPWKGGFGLGGVLGGCALSAYCAAKWTKQKPMVVMDALAPIAPLMIALSRLGEGLDGAGYGSYIEHEALRFFPIGIKNIYDEYFFSLFALEALVGLCLYPALLRLEKRKPLREGNIFLAFLVLFGAAQVILESLRRDQYLRWGFVRVGQLTALLMIVIAMAVFTIRILRLRGKVGRLVVDWALVLFCTSVGVAMEFAFDKVYFLPNWLGYILMGMALTGMAALAFSQMRRVDQLAMEGD